MPTPAVQPNDRSLTRHLVVPGAITGVREDVESYELQLPLPLWEPNPKTVPRHCLTEDTIPSIIDWAERFHPAAH